MCPFVLRKEQWITGVTGGKNAGRLEVIICKMIPPKGQKSRVYNELRTEVTLRKMGGFRKNPTPGGVPVRKTSPGYNVTNLQRTLNTVINRLRAA